MSRREYPTPRQWRNRIALLAVLTFLSYLIGMAVRS